MSKLTHMQTQKLKIGLVLPFLLFVGVSLIVAQETKTDLLDLVLRSPEERRGDYDALTSRWLEELPRHEGDFRAELLARRIREVSPFLKDPAAQIGALETAIGQLGDDGSSPGVLKNILKDLLAGLYRSGGEDDKAIELESASGHLRDWWVIGPFDKRGDREIDTVFPPETEQDLARTYEDGWQTLKWRAVRLFPHQIRFRFGARSGKTSSNSVTLTFNIKLILPSPITFTRFAAVS